MAASVSEDKGCVHPTKAPVAENSHVPKGAYSTVSTEADVRAFLLSKTEPISNIFNKVLETEDFQLKSFLFFF